MKFLKDIKIILAICLVLSWIGAGVGGYMLKQSKEVAIEQKEVEIVSLQSSLDQIGELVYGYRVLEDVTTGRKIEETDLEMVEIPLGVSGNVVQDMDELIGKYYKTKITAGTTLTYDMIYTEELTDDMRLFDVVAHNIPVGLKPGAFVDIRITLPMGEDFIAIPHRKVQDINAGVLKLAIKEEDIHVYNSMLVDSLIYTGTQIYAVEYIEGGIQSAADSFYPMSTNVLSVAQKDPNLLTAIKTDILQRRLALEEGISNGGLATVDVEELARVLERGKERYSDSFTEATREFERRQELLAEQENY